MNIREPMKNLLNEDRAYWKTHLGKIFDLTTNDKSASSIAGKQIGMLVNGIFDRLEGGMNEVLLRLEDDGK